MDSDVTDVSDVNDVSGVVLDVNDVLDGLNAFECRPGPAHGLATGMNDDSDLDVNVDLFQLTVWKQGSDNRMVLDDNRMVLDDWDVDLGQITVWGQGNDTDGFGHGLHKQFPQLLSGKGICFGISCSLLGVLP